MSHGILFCLRTCTIFHDRKISMCFSSVWFNFETIPKKKNTKKKREENNNVMCLRARTNDEHLRESIYTIRFNIYFVQIRHFLLLLSFGQRQKNRIVFVFPNFFFGQKKNKNGSKWIHINWLIGRSMCTLLCSVTSFSLHCAEYVCAHISDFRIFVYYN